MEMPKNYDETIADGDYESLKAGGYICKVISAKEEKNQNGKRMLVVAFDIAEGEHEGIYKRRYDELCKQNKDPNTVVKYPNNGIYRVVIEDNDGNCTNFFKGFITSIENSNNGYDFKANKHEEKTLKDKLFGGVFREEEYLNNRGEIKTSTKLFKVRSVDKIGNGEYEIPEIKKIQQNNNDIFSNVVVGDSDDDLPF